MWRWGVCCTSKPQGRPGGKLSSKAMQYCRMCQVRASFRICFFVWQEAPFQSRTYWVLVLVLFLPQQMLLQKATQWNDTHYASPSPCCVLVLATSKSAQGQSHFVSHMFRLFSCFLTLPWCQVTFSNCTLSAVHFQHAMLQLRQGK